MTSQPRFIYNTHVVDSINTHDARRYEESEWVPALCQATSLIQQHIPHPAAILPYTGFLFDHGSCHCPQGPDAVREFEYHLAFELRPHATIAYRGATYLPTAYHR